jgi:hypothetical protein
MQSDHPSPWNYKRRLKPNGKIVIGLQPPYSNDTLSTVRYEVPLLEPEVRQAAAVVRTSDASTNELREMFPELDKRCSDDHLLELIDRVGGEKRFSVKEFTIRVLADATGTYSPETILRYLKFNNSRQRKKSTRGRPRK